MRAVAVGADTLCLLAQDARLIELDCALPGVFVPERFEGREAVCESFRFGIDCLSPNTFAPLPGVLGQSATRRLRRADGALRTWNGLISHTSALARRRARASRLSCAETAGSLHNPTNTQVDQPACRVTHSDSKGC